MAGFEGQLHDLKEKLADKNHELSQMQSELLKVAEFRRHRSKMERDFRELKESGEQAEHEYSQALERTENQFLEQMVGLL